MGEKKRILITDGDDCLYKAPVAGYLFPAGIIARYLILPEFGYLRKPPTHPWVRKVFDNVKPRQDSKIYKWIQENVADKNTRPRKIFEAMLEDGTIGSRNKLMQEEGVYDLFIKMVEKAPTNPQDSLYIESLRYRGEQIKEILELFDEVWLYTSAKRKRAEVILDYMDVSDLFDRLITEEDNMPKSDPDNFRKILKKEGNVVVFVDDVVDYVKAAQEAGLRAFHTSEFLPLSGPVERLCKDNKLPCIRSFSELRPMSEKSFPWDTAQKRKKTPWYKKKWWKKKKREQDEEE